MDFFSALGEKLKDTSKSVVGKAKEVTEVAKLNSKIGVEEHKCQQAYIEIGKIFFKKNAGEIPDEYIPHMEVLNASLAEIENLKRGIKELKGERFCVGCGAGLGKTDIYCSNCGTKNELEEETVDVEPKKENVCPICKAILSPGDTICPTCGEPLKTEEEKQADYVVYSYKAETDEEGGESESEPAAEESSNEPGSDNDSCGCSCNCNSTESDV